MTEKAKDIVTAHGSRFTSESGDEKLARLAAGYIDGAVGSLPQADASSDLVRAQTYALIGIGHTASHLPSTHLPRSQHQPVLKGTKKHTPEPGQARNHLHWGLE